MASNIDHRYNYFYTKPDLKPSFIGRNTGYLWLLKPSFRNCVRII